MFGFCKPVSSKKRFLPKRKINEVYAFTLFEKAAMIPAEEWDAITKKQSIFLERDYLALIEHCGYTRLNCRYALIYAGNKPCGLVYFQIADFKAGVFGDLLSNQVDAIKSTRLNLFEKYIDSNKNEVLLRLFTCGNNLVSGEYGFLFDKKIKEKEAHEVLLELIDIVAKEEKLKGSISAVLIKDFHTPLKPAALFEGEKYNDFLVEPNLVVDIPEGVHTLEEYIALFSKKYRNRAKAIFKSFEGIEVKELQLEEIKAREKELYHLYLQIFEQAKFKLIQLPENYFSAVKALYPKQFKVKGFFLDGALVAFGSCFVKEKDCLEAHYIGLNYTLNNLHNLYQNMLYAMIGEALHSGLQHVNLGRTAAEIKTTVGAKPVDLICYIKPQNTISRIIQKPFIAFLQPGEWTPRNPFKEEVAGRTSA